MGRVLMWFAATVLLCGCAAGLPAPVYAPRTDRDVAFQLLVADNPYGVAPDVDVLALPPAAEPVLDAALAGKHSKQARTEAIGGLFVPGGGLDMHYETMATGTAAETFDTRRGNCLAYTHLFIAMARSRGIDARYREVLGVPQWQSAGDYVMLNRHIAAYGEFGHGGSYVADFGFLYESERNFGRVVSDDRARAQHFNNLGAAALVHGDVADAERLFGRGLTIDRGVNYLWTNLGTAHLRDGDPRGAEMAFQQALALIPWDVTALNQLTRLYSGIGRDDLAAIYRQRSEGALRQNPYQQFAWAIEARKAGDLDKAANYLRRATNREPEEIYFWLELAQVDVLRADGRAAKRDLYRAQALAQTVEQQKAFKSMIDEVVRLSASASGKPAPVR
jgi:tetratricopeptide (TPR) repeat protein